MNTETNIQRYRPGLAFYHPNGKGTGSAVRMELHPAHDDVDGSIFLSAANQLTVGDRNGPHPTFPRFDWENKLVVKLDFTDLCKILQVFRGECESLEGGKGLYHRTAQFATHINLRHLVEPVPGYSLELYRGSSRKDEDRRVHVQFSDWEALGLAESISGSMAVVSFGIPMVIPRGEFAAEERRRRDELAA